MKITKSTIVPKGAVVGTMFHVDYSSASSYIVLAVSDWLKKLKLNLGKFNRIVFKEGNIGSEADLKIGFNNFQIGVKHEFVLGVDKVEDSEFVHKYFIRKFLEGFKRFDEHFQLVLTPELEKYLEEYFSSGYRYEKQKVSKRIGKHKYQVIYQYFYNTFNLVLRVVDKAGDVAIEQILESDKPDLILNSYNYYKVTIEDNKVCVYENSGKVRKSFSLEPFYVH